MEGDIVAAMLAYTYGISTHALTWRATAKTEASNRSILYFYPRPHMEGDIR